MSYPISAVMMRQKGGGAQFQPRPVEGAAVPASITPDRLILDDADLEDVYNTERHLLDLACTRARDQLLVTAVQPASEFLDDLRQVDRVSKAI